MTGEEWVDKFLKHRRLTWDRLTLFDQNRVTRAVPCTVRCWRVGGPVDVRVGERCPECGKVHQETHPAKAIPGALDLENPQLSLFPPNRT